MYSIACQLRTPPNACVCVCYSLSSLSASLSLCARVCFGFVRFLLRVPET